MNDVISRLGLALADRYRIERELGQGGMATVYLAHDLRHDRQVALKVLRSELAAVIGAERFLHEIKTTANLQHPHILPLFDSGTVDGTVFYAMPFVEGESLRDRLSREKQLSVEDAVRITSEVASALDYAHRHGVIHRDIKPENILLHDGSAMVADFGIALAASRTGGSRMTETGMSLGTPHYMSPEQAMGERELDARTDVYALGCVGYEMLCGEPPFTGPTAQAIVARVVTEEPRSLTLQRKTIPPHVESAMFTALAKLPADRFASAALFAAALRNPSFTSARTGAAAGILPPVRRRAAGPLAIGTAAALLGGAAIGWWAGRGREAPKAGLVTFGISTDSGRSFHVPAVSPDGSTIVYRLDGPTGGQLFLRHVSELEGRPIPGTENARFPFFSPDGAWIAFETENVLKKLRLEGGTPITLAGISGIYVGGVWTPDHTIIFSVWGRRSLHRVSENGGTPQDLGPRDTTVTAVLPEVVPGSSRLLVTAEIPGIELLQLAVLDPQSGSIRSLGAGMAPRFLDSGSIVFASNDGRLFLQAFDPAAMDTVGPPVQIGSNVYSIYGLIPFFAASRTGTIVYVPGGSAPSDLELVDRAGTSRIAISGRQLWAPRFSPDARRIVYGGIAPGQVEDDIWLFDLKGGTSQRLTFEGSDSNDPVWSPDGNEILYSSARGGAGKDLYVQSVHQTGDATAILQRPWPQWPSDWSRDGKTLVFTDATGGPTGWDIWTAPRSGGEAKPFLVTSFREVGGRLSPDGKWITYASNETGRDEVYVQAFPVPGNKAVISLSGGRDPVWGPSGRELFYWQRSQLMVAALTSTSPLAVTSRQPLFRRNYTQGAQANYDVAPDGKSFAIITGGALAERLVVMLNVAPDR